MVASYFKGIGNCKGSSKFCSVIQECRCSYIGSRQVISSICWAYGCPIIASIGSCSSRICKGKATSFTSSKTLRKSLDRCWCQ